MFLACIKIFINRAVKCNIPFFNSVANDTMRLESKTVPTVITVTIHIIIWRARGDSGRGEISGEGGGGTS